MNRKISLLMITIIAFGCSCGLIHGLSWIEVLVQQKNESYTEFLVRFTEIKGELWKNEYKVTDIFFCKIRGDERLLGIIIYKKKKLTW